MVPSRGGMPASGGERPRLSLKASREEDRLWRSGDNLDGDDNNDDGDDDDEDDKYEDDDNDGTDSGGGGDRFDPGRAPTSVDWDDSAKRDVKEWKRNFEELQEAMI